MSRKHTVISPARAAGGSTTDLGAVVAAWVTEESFDAVLMDSLNDAFSDQHSEWHSYDLVRSHHMSAGCQDRWAERSKKNLADVNLGSLAMPEPSVRSCVEREGR